MTDTNLRPSQEAVLAYDGGKMAVTAVPGAGKTFTLSHLAARLAEQLADAGLAEEQEVLIVTFTNPAVNSFRRKIADLLRQERGLLPYVGYRVRTLHGLAHDIVRMRPGLVGLTEGFEIVDEGVSAGIIRDLAEGWTRVNADELLPYMDQSAGQEEDQLLWRVKKDGPELVEGIAREVIRMGKDHRWDPAEMLDKLDTAPLDLPLARMGIRLFADYQRALSYRGAVDFDDLVRLAMQALQTDKVFLKRLQSQWPFILEDEAQDSSQLQNEMLRLLSGGRNWVRVGDPNQSIYTTFTTANANLLRQFARQKNAIERPLPESGRSSPAIIALANELVRWSRIDPLIPHLHEALADQRIEPTGSGDQQPNPPDGFIYLDWDPEKNITPELEISRVVGSIEKWLPDHQDWTVAVLAPDNSRGFQVAEELKNRNIPYEELLRSTSATRDAAARLQGVFDFLAEPTNGRALGRLYADIWWPKATGSPDDPEMALARDTIKRALNDLTTTEDFLWPGPESNWLASLVDTLDEMSRGLLERFRMQVQIWLQAGVLTVDQLALTISQDLFDDPADLALGHKIAVVLGGIAANNPDYRLPELSDELRKIAQNQRRFLGFDEATTGYEPRQGVVTVATMHAAKGLEWDRVYLMAVNSYSFPIVREGESFQSEKWFVRDQLNLQAEVHEQAQQMMAGKAGEYQEGKATAQARIEYAAERLRLLYVGITRAKRDLVMTWNMGRFWEQGRKNEAAAALIALSAFQKKPAGEAETEKAPAKKRRKRKS
ncbi:MAG: ATP-dependent helicase [Anaerolineae bacterium]|nr:ATP-dependent helicase [Anaerolineae bacterium]